ncbi:MAG: sugar phosphate isomerase/epimerase [Treponema sp.]|jgi:sugar phosphate isomerase/epimerase|nr:sugar phosphate isomerase/epimerase [Treponema sp.]
MDISLQLWSIKEEVKEDFAHALEITEKAGYQGVEFAGYHGKTPEELGELLARYHLKSISAHVALGRLRGSFDEEINYAKKLGHKMIVCPKSECKTEAETIEDAQFLESCAQKAAGDGIIIGYHNHAQEFKRFNGKYAMDILLENMPSVQFEPDVFWLAYAGLDPITYIKPFVTAGRICAIHAKELAKEGTENVYIGQGRIDFAGLAAICSPSKYSYIVEQEEFSTDHFDGIFKSCQGLRALIS